jgi:enterochelin esterase family protein
MPPIHQRIHLSLASLKSNSIQLNHVRKLAMLILFSVPGIGQVQPFAPASDLASPKILALRKEVESGNRAAVDQFWEDLWKNHAPLIEPIAGENGSSLVTFVWQGAADTRNVVLTGGVAGYDFKQLTHLSDTDLWYKTYRIRNDARFTYSFVPNDSLEPLDTIDPRDGAALAKRVAGFQADPLNPNKVIYPPGAPIPPVAYVELPGAPAQPWIMPLPGVVKGTVEQKKITSKILKDEIDVWVYTPPGFTPQGERYPLVVAFDGPWYVNQVPVPVIVNNLIVKKMLPPMVAIVINTVGPKRTDELECSVPFTDFIATEVAPWMRANYHATTDPGKTVVGGSSLGGLESIFAAWRHPEVFGNVLSQSASLWWAPEHETESDWLARQFVNSPKLPIRFFLEVGLMEFGLATREQIQTNRHMRDVLQAKGYAIHYQEFNGDHDWHNWRGSFADGLLSLMGTEGNNSTQAPAR